MARSFPDLCLPWPTMMIKTLHTGFLSSGQGRDFRPRFGVSPGSVLSGVAEAFWPQCSSLQMGQNQQCGYTGWPEGKRGIWQPAPLPPQIKVPGAQALPGAWSWAALKLFRKNCGSFQKAPEAQCCLGDPFLGDRYSNVDGFNRTLGRSGWGR